VSGKELFKKRVVREEIFVEEEAHKLPEAPDEDQHADFRSVFCELSN
jgi:hypothetical protein